MKNKYKINGETTIIYLKKRSGEVFETLIDTEDLERILKLDYSWHVFFAVNNQSYYAKATAYLGTLDGKPKYKTVYLHRVIMEAYTNNEHIDHIHHNTLDNRKVNLCSTENKKNLKNRKGANKNNTTGYRNVSYDKSTGEYIVQLQIEGQHRCLGRFDDVDEAGAFAEAMRLKYYKAEYEHAE